MNRRITDHLSKPSPLPQLLLWEFLGWILGISLLVFSAVCIGLYLYTHRTNIYPGITIDTIPVGGLTVEQARQELQQNEDLPEFTVTLINERDPEIKLASNSAELNLHRNYEEILAFAYSYGRTGTTFEKLQAIFHASNKHPQLHTQFAFDEHKVATFVEAFEQQLFKEGKEPQLKLSSSGNKATLTVEVGEPGQKLNTVEATKQVFEAATHLKDTTLPFSPLPAVHVLTEEEKTAARTRAESLVGKSITVEGEDYTFSLRDIVLLTLLQLPQGYKAEEMQKLTAEWAKRINRPAQNASFSYDKNSLKVSSFQPDRDGLALDEEKTRSLLEQELQALENSQTAREQKTITLPLSSTAADTTLSQTNNLGITERIGWGESTYKTSIPNRVHNVQITAERVNNIIVAPGEEFSFNNTLGDISAETGYKTAYVIKNGRTELGDGGGVCQVSTTLFRALLDSGLAITRRLPHSYRVGYYEQNSEPGFDATVYSGGVDLRFKNDTTHHLLIHTTVDSATQYLKMEIFGTSDGRTAEIINYKKGNATAAPPPEYFPDASLSPGERRQIDWAVGGLNTEFTHVVKDKDGQIKSEKTYKSNYKPWSAKYLVGP